MTINIVAYRNSEAHFLCNDASLMEDNMKSQNSTCQLLVHFLQYQIFQFLATTSVLVQPLCCKETYVGKTFMVYTKWLSIY